MSVRVRRDVGLADDPTRIFRCVAEQPCSDTQARQAWRLSAKRRSTRPSARGSRRSSRITRRPPRLPPCRTTWRGACRRPRGFIDASVKSAGPESGSGTAPENATSVPCP